MPDNDPKENLRNLLQKLKRNLEFMPKEQLKIQYSQGYSALCNDISIAVEVYAKSIMFSGIRIHSDYVSDAIKIIQKLLRSTALSKKLSNAAFVNMDIDEITKLAVQFHSLLQDALMPLYCSHISLLLIPECLEEPPAYPLIYSKVNNSIYHDHTWTEIIQVKTNKYQQQKEK